MWGRKLIVVIFSIVLFATSVNFHIDRHFCGNDVFSISFVGHAKSCCDEPCSDCHNETVFLSFDEDFVPTVISCLAPIVPITIEIPAIILPGFQNNGNFYIESSYYPDSPPLILEYSRPEFSQEFLC